MKLSDGIQIAYQRKWSMINTFTVQIISPLADFDESINLSIVSFQTPDFTNDPIEAFIANKWRIHNGKDALYRFTITFRDYDQMSLYSKFKKIYRDQHEMYFDDMKMTIIIEKDGDWLQESAKKIMEFEGAMIEGVSNLSFSNETENQIAEFTVNFKCTEPTVY